MVKMLENSSHSNGKKEEWVYYDINTADEEHYFFQNGQLTNWEKGQNTPKIGDISL